MGELFMGDSSVLEDASLLSSKELTLVEPYLENTLFVKFCSDVVMVMLLQVLGIVTLFVLSYLTRLPFYPFFPLPTPLRCMHTMSP